MVAEVSGPPADFAGAGWPALLVLGSQFSDQRGYFRRNRGRQWRHRKVTVRQCDVRWRTGEWRAPGEALIGHDAKRVHVASGGCGRAGEHFGGQVGRRAEQDLGADARPASKDMRDPEISDLHLAVRSEQQVTRLDITVDQASQVGRAQACCGLGYHIHGVRGIQRAVGQ